MNRIERQQRLRKIKEKLEDYEFSLEMRPGDEVDNHTIQSISVHDGELKLQSLVFKHNESRFIVQRLVLNTEAGELEIKRDYYDADTIPEEEPDMRCPICLRDVPAGVAVYPNDDPERPYHAMCAYPDGKK